MPDPKRPDPRRRSPTSRPAAGGRSGNGAARGTARKATAKSSANRKEVRTPDKPEAQQQKAKPEIVEPVRQSLAAAAEQQSEQRLGFTARRAAILAAVVCVLTLTIAGPVRTYFAQRTEMQQLAATEAGLRAQIAELEGQKTKLGDPVYIAAQARERLGFVMPGDIPYQVQLPPGSLPARDDGGTPTAVHNGDPWYTSLWKTIADTPHPPPAAPAVPALPGLPTTPGAVPDPDGAAPPAEQEQPGG